jgi:hypothetical protein
MNPQEVIDKFKQRIFENDGKVDPEEYAAFKIEYVNAVAQEIVDCGPQHDSN